MKTQNLSSTLHVVSWLKVVLLLALSLPSHAAPMKACRHPVVRKEWRTLTDAEKHSYISAVQCITRRPALISTIDIPGVRTHYDDFVAYHQFHAPRVHWVGIFYPWHRLFVHQYEKALNECGFKGGQPYWDWTLDAGSPEDFYNSPIFNTTTGFGGNGLWIPGNYTHPAPGEMLVAPELIPLPDRTGGGCITDGPFRNMTSNLGPLESTAYNPRCIRRDFAYSMFNKSSESAVQAALANPDFGYFTQRTEVSIHGGVHIGVGGLYGGVRDTAVSPNDPLFFLHHSSMDRAWWSWQNKNLTARLLDISGPLEPKDYGNKVAGNATLDTVLSVGTKVNVSSTVRDVMHIQSGTLCYAYDSLF